MRHTLRDEVLTTLFVDLIHKQLYHLLPQGTYRSNLMYKRKLQINLPLRQSAFLWGARQTGKSSFLRSHYPKSIYYDLLNTHELIRFSTAPYLLREEILAMDKQKLQ